MTTNGLLFSMAKASFHLGSAKAIAADLSLDKEQIEKYWQFANRKRVIAAEQKEFVIHAAHDLKAKYLSSNDKKPEQVQHDGHKTALPFETI